MEATSILGLFGGLALFLYGMHMMSNGLEDIAGNKMKRVLEKLTSNRFLGVAVGAGITAVIQSSSATTVMAVGFVNSGIMTLEQAVWIIMGANIGTTITGQLIALDAGMLAPIIAFIGVAMVVFLKSVRVHHTGKILAGLGILFLGMNMMSEAMVPLREMPLFVSVVTGFESPLVGIVAGALFTALIQSSSASVGILQALAVSGLIDFKAAVFVLFGQNIGTCITALLASVGANKNAKRTTVIHFLFNIIGTVVFAVLCIFLPVTEWISLLSDDPANQIANMHTIFNVATTLMLLPFGTLLAKLSKKLLPDGKEEVKPVSELALFTDAFGKARQILGATAVRTDLLSTAISRIVDLAGENTNAAFEAIIKNDFSSFDEIKEREETIDKLNKEISQYVSKILVHNNIGQNVADIEQYFLITGNAERIGDHALNIAGYGDVIKDKKIVFSDGAKKELLEMQTIVKNALKKSLNKETDVAEWLSDIAAMEQKIDDMTREYRDKHLERMRQGKCSEEACVLYSELLTDFERLGDHILNIAQAYSKIEQ